VDGKADEAADQRAVDADVLHLSETALQRLGKAREG
jgi:hypothetical protein